MSVLSNIITQHAEEAAFLWILRDQAVRAPHYNLKDLVKLDTRVEAHIDGLRIAGDVGWDICAEQLSWEEPGEVFAAAVLAFSSGDAERIAVVLEVAAGGLELQRGLISALGWLPTAHVLPVAETLLSTETPWMQRVGLATLAAHRVPHPSLGAHLLAADPALRARALQAAGELGAREYLGPVKAARQEADPTCRYRAAISAVLLGDPSPEALVTLAESGGSGAAEAAAMAARLLPIEDLRWWFGELLSDDATARAALAAAGASGEPSLIPRLLEALEVPALARPAGEAIALITGVDIAYLDLDADAPDDFESGPTEDPSDDDVSMDPDEDLPWPEPARMVAWWSEAQGRFSGGMRYLLGHPLSPEAARDALVHGWQRQRIAGAIELAHAQPGPLFPTKAPGWCQRSWL